MRLRIGLVALLLPMSLPAQIRASELGSISQVIDGTTIRVEYSRPRARGRTAIFGTKAVQWNETWTPGANWATTLDVDKPVKVNGHAIPKGKYSVWMVVREKGDWTFVIDPKWRQYHEDHPDSNPRQIRFPVQKQGIPFTEVLTWSMPELRVNGGTLAMDWERARIAVDIEVQPSYTVAISAEDAQPYLGAFTSFSVDSSGKQKGESAPFTITYENGVLEGRWTPDDPYMKQFALIRIAPDWFAPGLYDSKGQIYEVLKPDLIFEFTRANGRVIGFSMRDMEDGVVGRGIRR
jgi:hypothetical protein